MIDSSAKPGSGMLKGHVFHAGDYEQCLDVNEVVNGREIVGKYCNMLFKPNKNFPWGHSGLRQDVSSDKRYIKYKNLGVCSTLR